MVMVDIFHSFWGLSESTIRSETGHFQIFAKGFEANKVKEPWGYKLSNLPYLENGGRGRVPF